MSASVHRDGGRLTVRLALLRRARRSGAAAVLLLAAVLLAACGGSEDLNTRLRDMTLQANDLPAEFAANEGRFSTNEDLADDAAELEKLEGWERLLGYEVTYKPESVPDLPFIAVTSTVSLYGSDQGAIQSLAEGIADARQTDWEATYVGFGQLEVEEIDRPDLADQVLWLRITGYPGGNPESGIVIDDLVLTREGSARSFLRVATQAPETSDRRAFLEDVEALARAQLEHIRQVLDLD